MSPDQNAAYTALETDTRRACDRAHRVMREFATGTASSVDLDRAIYEAAELHDKLRGAADVLAQARMLGRRAALQLIVGGQ